MQDEWMFRAVLVLVVGFSRNLTSGHADRASPDPNTPIPHSHLPAQAELEGSRKESFEMGRMVTLLCTSTKIQWSKMIYVIWKIHSQEKNCSITVAVNDSDFNTCQDEKDIAGDYSLNIPHFSFKDEGIYKCDVSYRAGDYEETIHVSAWARPIMTGWLETEGGHTVAVCEVQSLPAASIHWEIPWNSSLPETHSSRDGGGVFTVTSRLQLLPNAAHNNLTCVVTGSHFRWPETRITTFMFKDTVQQSSDLLRVFFIWLFIKLLILLCFIHMKPGQFRKICCTSRISSSAGKRNPQPHENEEVELHEQANFIHKF